MTEYRKLSDADEKALAEAKRIEEEALVLLAQLANDDVVDQRWVSIAKTELQKAFMCLTRSITNRSEL